MFQDCELEQLRKTSGGAASTVRDLGKLERIVTDRISAAQVPDLRPIRDLLAEADTLLRTKLAERTDTGDVRLEVTASAGNGVPAEVTSPSGSESATSTGGNRSATIAGHEDVVRMLDRICDYYARNEPSSPVPLLLQRARRLVTKDFVGMVQDLVPDCLAQIEAIRGQEGDD